MRGQDRKPDFSKTSHITGLLVRMAGVRATGNATGTAFPAVGHPNKNPTKPPALPVVVCRWWNARDERSIFQILQRQSAGRYRGQTKE